MTGPMTSFQFVCLLILITITPTLPFRLTSQILPFKTFNSHERALSIKKIICSVIAICVLPSFPVHALVDFESNDKSFSFAYPKDFQLSPKPLKTHSKETLLTSTDVKGFTAGLTIDKVKILQLKEFATPKELGDKVLNVEKSKEGFIDGSVIQAIEETQKNNIYYTIDYVAESTRGKNHYLVKASVVDRELYVFTVQCKEADYVNLADEARGMINSFVVNKL